MICNCKPNGLGIKSIGLTKEKRNFTGILSLKPDGNLVKSYKKPLQHIKKTTIFRKTNNSARGLLFNRSELVR